MRRRFSSGGAFCLWSRTTCHYSLTPGYRIHGNLLFENTCRYRDYHQLSQSEIAGGKRISQHLSTNRSRMTSDAAHLSFLIIRGTARLDVLVEPQHIIRVVPFLDLDQSSVIRAVRRFDERI